MGKGEGEGGVGGGEEGEGVGVNRQQCQKLNNFCSRVSSNLTSPRKSAKKANTFSQ